MLGGLTALLRPQLVWGWEPAEYRKRSEGKSNGRGRDGDKNLSQYRLVIYEPADRQSSRSKYCIAVVVFISWLSSQTSPKLEHGFDKAHRSWTNLGVDDIQLSCRSLHVDSRRFFAARNDLQGERHQCLGNPRTS